MQVISDDLFLNLEKSLEGTLLLDDLSKTLYSTDASVYRVIPSAIARPKHVKDLKVLIDFANKYHVPLIPRAAGTSLAGQVVGEGIIVDVSFHMNQILEINIEEEWVRVQPGIVRDELNHVLEPQGYFFSPITSTANRAMIGGMVGNNSCGTNSIVYGSTRDHVLELKMLLSDGEEAKFKGITKQEIDEKRKLTSLEGKVYEHIYSELSDEKVVAEIDKNFPKKTIHRRNTGYAVDYLVGSDIFSDNNTPFNLAKLICGSEGTLGIISEVKLHIDHLPPPEIVVVAAHFKSLSESMKATQVAMQNKPHICELMDKVILDCTKTNIEQRKNRFFINGDPEALLLIEFRGENKEECRKQAEVLIADFKKNNLGYVFPLIYGSDSKKVWQLRNAGLGSLANLPDDGKAVACIEDTAVDLEDLPNYIEDFGKLMERHGQKAVYYAHAGAGEIHLRPILDLKKSEGVKEFYNISLETAHLVKKYNGSLSGEHGDGRVRAPFIPIVLGEDNYQLFKRIKKTWDPHNIFNPGKIVDAPPMTEALRYEADIAEKQFDTKFDFHSTGGILRTAEKCNGSGDCRKLPISGGTMCPSYQATHDERDSTRGRANTLREYLTNSTKENPFDHAEIKEVMDLCLSCKGCTAECPSNVDMTTLKSEFQYQFMKENGAPLRSKFFANYTRLMSIGMMMPRLSNFLINNSLTAKILKTVIGVSPKRSLPNLGNTTLRKWFLKQKRNAIESKSIGKKLYFFCDEFTNYNDVEIGTKAILLLQKLGYEVVMIDHPESGRAALSKGFLDQAQNLANRQIDLFEKKISAETPLIGVEPSAILSFRDEYPRLVSKNRVEAANYIKKHTFLIDEFLSDEIKKGSISSELFTSEEKSILLHGHCHQKALSSIDHSAWLLSLPENYEVEIIPSGCCGMAGSFGYEKEHYKISQKIAEMVLFPAIRNAQEEVIIAAPGTSCRHQIKDGLKRKALHPVEVLYDALI